ncbi:unnamed protein product [Caenorhabditis bovis]|uniref:PWWP domain-containing protein n=1 Tax=Caenorhabditis bovis TaxID=2654633 RepID=A0A8S1FA10_9PELO|nr:unnamed protein product [Caenorhabditis bovis]
MMENGASTSTAAATTTTPTACTFKPGDLIWAKMKGFPPWPAKVLEQTDETPARRIPVMFFGTLEKSFMKPTDLSDYLTNRTLHEIPRKQKDFNKAVQEIRVAAGLATEQDDVSFPVSHKSPPSSPRNGRTRQTSGRFLDVLLSGGLDGRRKRSNSASTKSRSRASSNASAFKIVKDLMKKERRRLDSESSHGSKRKMISGGLNADHCEQYADSTDFNALFGDAFLGDLASLPDDNKSWKSKRSRGSSKLFDDLIFGARTRNRSGSASGRRSRMISMSGFSGVSDMFDELLNGPLDLDAQAEQFMITLNNMPSDGSLDRPLSPETSRPQMPAPVEFCPTCGYEYRLINGVLKCNSTVCTKMKESSSSAVDGLLDDESRNKLDIPLAVNIKTESVSSGEKFINSMLMAQPTHKKSGLANVKQEAASPKPKIRIKEDSASEAAETRKERKRKKVQVMSPTSPSTIQINSANDESAPPIVGGRSSPSLRRDRARPKHYKVEKTPPISASGHRHCVFCNGQVRPQMCGGNRHRWRCVYKKCRKWYGWVRSHEEIPKNVGRKKINSLKSSAKPSKSKKKEDDVDETSYPALLKRKVGRPSKNDIKIRLKMQKEAAAMAARAPPSPMHAEASTASNPSGVPHRKYTKRKNKEGNAKRDDFSPIDDESKKRAVSPLSEKEMHYRPCAMEKRARWWTGEKRRVDVSPERDFGTTAADTAAAFRMMAHAVRSAAVTRADELGTVNGSLDLLMDTLMGSMGPLLSLLEKVPAFKTDSRLPQQLWNASAIHIPTFQ